jgi:hypothetical protein
MIGTVEAVEARHMGIDKDWKGRQGCNGGACTASADKV